MTKKELEKLEHARLCEEIPLLDNLYVSVSRRKHESGYKMYKIYGVSYGKNREITYAKCLSEMSDVINIVPTFLNGEYGFNYSVLSIDSTETNLFRFFTRGNSKIKVKFTLSDFEFEIVKVVEE